MASSNTREGATAAATTRTMTTTAVTRSWSDMHTPTWLMLLAANITARTLVFHPLELAVCRKRVTREASPPSLLSLLRAAYRGGGSTATAAAATTTTTRYQLGRGGVRGLYRGVGAALTANLLGEVSFLITLERMKEYLEDSDNKNDNDNGSSGGGATAARDTNGVSGTPAAVGAMCADLVALAIATPFVLVANRQMTAAYGMATANTYNSFVATWREMWHMHHPRQQQQSPRRRWWWSTSSTVAVATDKEAATAAANKSGRAMGVMTMGCSSSSGTSSRGYTAWLSRSRCVQDVRWWANGMRGLYRGTTAGLLRIPSSGCWWALYTKSKAMLYDDVAPLLQRWRHTPAVQHEGNSNSNSNSSWLLSSTDNPVLNAMAATIASALTTLLFNPLAVIQTRQQTLQSTAWQTTTTTTPSSSALRDAAQSTDSCRHRLRGWRRCVPFRRVGQLAVDMAKKEGLRGFFKGAPANVAVSVLDGVVFSLLFELTKLGSDVAFLHTMHASSEASVH